MLEAPARRLTGIRLPKSVLLNFDGGSHSAWLFAWLALVALYYAPFAFPAFRVLEPDDLLGSEFVWNVATGRWWFGDSSVAKAFLVGNVPVAVLPRLTQPLILLYGVLPPLAAYLTTDIIVRGVAALGAFSLLRALHVPRAFQHTLAALFALNIENSTFALSIAGLPAAAFLMGWQKGRSRLLLILLIAWNSSLYLTGIFFVAAAPFFQSKVFRRALDRDFVVGLFVYAIGLGLGNLGLIWLALTSQVHWHREEWGLFPAEGLFPFRGWQIHVGHPLLLLFAIAAVLGFADRRVRCTTGFAAFVIGWYQLLHVIAVQQWLRSFGGPLANVQLDRLYFLWTFNLVLAVGLASCQAGELRRSMLLAATLVALPVAASSQQHVRQLMRSATGYGGGYPPFAEYYHFKWFEGSGLNSTTPVMSVGLDPMIAPMNGVPSIDGHFALYPLQYKHRFRAIIRNTLGPSGTTELFDSWGNKVYAFYPPNKPQLLDFCAARALGAVYIISALPIPSKMLTLKRNGELKLYEITGECGR